MLEQTRLLAMRIRELRDVAGYSVEETAKKLNIETKRYAQYEQDGTDIPISVIYSLAHIYNVDTTDILSGKSPKNISLSFVKKGQGIKVERFEGYKFENIAYSFLHRTMEPMIVTLEPDGEIPKMVMHGGQEINYCLEGVMVLYHDGNEIILEEGDCVYFDPKKPHGQRAEGDVPAKFLTVINE
ncbi:MAG: cupin domain-containing protein [Oscillospiraceae bacterium]|nr:cupin domain-containing protein [Oscillospiraceae bacterium]